MTHIPYLRSSTTGPQPDRRARVLIMGILLLALAGLCVLILALTIYGVDLIRVGGPPMGTFRRIIGAMLIYGTGAAFFLATGLGSLMRKRWARPVVLAVAWSWLLAGACVAAVLIQRIVNAQQVIYNTLGFNSFTAAIMAITLLLGLGLPLVLILLYKSPDVQLTLMFYDPVQRWTDGVPVSVLGLCFFMLLTAIGVMANGFTGVAPLLGFLLTGPTAVITMLMIAGLFVLATWWDYRLETRGWLLSLALFIFVPLSILITFLRSSMEEMYQAAGMSPQQIDMIRDMNGMSMSPMLGWVMFGGVIGIGYLVLVHSYYLER